jgi:aminoglycoside phosphotransferase (APT) family kinase protein
MSSPLLSVLARFEPVIAVTPLSRRGQSPAFHLELRSGRAWKARVFATPGAARHIERLLRAPTARDLPRPVGCHGRVLLTEFIEGRPVDHVIAARPRSEPALARQAGALLGRLHRGKAPSGPSLAVAFFRSALRRGLALLTNRALLDAEEARALAQLRAPGRAPLVLTHGDLCPENLVAARDGRLRAIDEERLAVRPPGFELARTITRWPLSPALETRLLEHYARAGGDAASFVAFRPFWLASALTTSIGYRLRVAPEAVGPALAALRALARA